jgi:hypothetical protein
MNKTSFSEAGNIELRFQINRAGSKTFIFKLNDEDEDITGTVFEFFVKRYAGDREKIISLTWGSGLSIPVYYDNRILVEVTATQTNIKEGEYYWELYRTDIQKTKLSGIALFKYDP